MAWHVTYGNCGEYESPFRYDDSTHGFRAAHVETGRCIPIRFVIRGDADRAARLLNEKAPCNGLDRHEVEREVLEQVSAEPLRYILERCCMW